MVIYSTDLCFSQLAMFMNPVAAFVYSNSSVLADKYKSLGTILVSSVSILATEKHKLNKLWIKPEC